MRCKTKYMVICRLVDCENDFGIFPLCDDSTEPKPREFDRVSDARKAMRRDYVNLMDALDVDWSEKSKKHCKRFVEKNFISIDVPIWDGENQKDSWVRARWTIVSL